MTTAREEQEPCLDLLVHRMTWESDGVLSVELTHPEGKPLPAWEPGAHLDLVAGEHTRQYSLCGDPRDSGRYRIGVLNEPSSRGGSRYVHTELRPGATVTVRGPRNHFRMVPAERYLFLAGGIGITPLLPMAREAARQGIPWRLVHGGRCRDAMAFGAELAELAQQSGPAQRTEPTGEVLLHPQDERGHIDLEAALTGLDAPGDGTLVYCCGPEPLLAAAEERCAALGIADRLRVERFAAPATRRDGRDGRDGRDDEGDTDAEFEVECRRSGRTVRVGSGTSVIDAVESVGVSVPSSCRDGICGTCETRVLDGTPDHRDYVLSEAEHASGESMMICVSRCSSGRLVLDL